MSSVFQWARAALARLVRAASQRALAALRRTRAALPRGLAAADAYQRRHGWLGFPFAVIRKLSNDGGGSLAGLIAYYGFLGVFPLLLVFAAILGFVLAADPGLQTRVLTAAESSFPSMQGFISNTISGNGVALGVGLAVALWAGLGVTRATERAMNAIWDIPLAERPSLWWSRVRGLAMLCILGGTFLVSTALAGLRGSGGALAVLTDVLAVTGSLLLNVVLYLLAFQVLTNRHLAWRQIMPGALVGAVGWTALQNLGAYYVRHEVAHASQLYGSLAVVVGLLAWIYLGAQLTLYAAEINVVLAYRLWPRSLSRAEQTDADRRALIRQAQEAGRAAGELISVSFGGSGPQPSTGGPAAAAGQAPPAATAARPPGVTAAQAGPASPRAHATHAAVAQLGARLGDLDRYRQQAEACEDPAARGSLLHDLRAAASDAGAALADLARQEADLDEALTRHFGWPAGRLRD